MFPRDDLPPGCDLAELDALYGDERDERDERLSAPGEHGLCVPCAAEGYAVPALPDSEVCEECRHGPVCEACGGYGTFDGLPEGRFVNGAWAWRGAPPCLRCCGTGSLSGGPL
jgi:hypothetical protein